MLRRVQLAPMSLVIVLSSGACITGCEGSGASLTTLPVAYGGSGQGGAATNGGNAFLQGGQGPQGGSSPSSNPNQGGNQARGGSGNGGSVASNGGSVASNGGSVVGNGGSVVGNGGSVVTGSGGATVAQTCTTDLMTLREGTTNDWIVNTSGKSCGVQGSVFGFGDTTSWVPPTTPICTAGATGQCCISGTTVTDSTYAKYGAGMGLDLNSTGGTTPTKLAYSGAAKGFKFTLTGTFPASAMMRIMYAPGATVPAQTDPYKEMAAAAGTYTVMFADVTCPAWATTGCPAPSTTPYQFKVQLNGGTATGVGAYNFCITSILPVTS